MDTQKVAFTVNLLSLNTNIEAAIEKTQRLGVVLAEAQQLVSQLNTLNVEVITDVPAVETAPQ